MRSLIALFLTTAPAFAETPMTGAEFEAYVEGRTISFGTTSNPTYGLEQYLPNREVIWSPAPGECTYGVWFDQDQDICFVYEGDPEPKCWRTYLTDDGIRAEFTNRPDGTIIFEDKGADAALICPGPELIG